MPVLGRSMFRALEWWGGRAATPGRLRLRTSLIALVGLSLLPAVVFSGLVVRELWHQQVDELGKTLRQANAALATAVEREIGSTIRTLRAIAESPVLTSGTLAQAHEENQRTLVSQPAWRAIVLLSPDGAHLSDTRISFGLPLPRAGELRHIARVAASQQPAVSDVYIDQSRTHVVEVAVPVLRNGRLKYILAAPLRLERFAELLLTEGVMGGGGAAAILDSQLRFVARARDPASSVGRSPSPEFAALLQKIPAGYQRSRTLEGDAVYSSWVPTAHGWRVAIGFPAAPMDAALRTSLLWILVGGMAAFGLSLAAAVAWSARLSRAIGRTAAAAARLGTARSPGPAVSMIREIHALQAAHLTVDARLRHEQDERRRSEAERVRLLAVAEIARAEAERTNRAKDEFLAMLSHELRNPLAAISHAAAVLDVTAVSDERSLRAREIIRRQLGHLTRIVDDLLDIARMTTGKIALDRRPVELGQAVERCLASLLPQLHSRLIMRTVEPVWVLGDETRLEQIVGNLVSNALKYTPMDKPIRIAVTQEHGEAVLRIEDEGAGIDPTLLPHVFDLFTQGRRPADRGLGGLGLGLTVVRRLVELHEGRIEAASAGSGHGSVFTVRLPAHAPPVTPERSSLSRPSPESRRVLIVEDNDDARLMLTTLLETAGHKVYAASDGTAGVEMALGLDVDVALIDLRLPGIDGYEVARQIRRGRGPALRLVALTGYGLPEHQVQARAAGFDAHLVKPVTLQGLAAAMVVGAPTPEGHQPPS